ncbi:hypothetical protein A2982_02705 [candidate division WWE3 bacterium RIFCSPLOWO2_01_FULL_39_13]|uniref:Zinc finger DksA/TraR C4-type domain-containing protein n=1 Tax=candidate division WWE3 bacterium RIFCSPLOWO2_01_FULL_39_13 TaxID=1802624 RepID=A0A1F4V4J5_UNCKA|nr:MAG: hypothetical protein A2982_02705 [candidate division WWE3 bacterium RIFCSPLOWO2_01_FULL_39_13]
MNLGQLTIFFTILAFITFAFVYWKDATAEGFSTDKIIDSFLIIILGGLLGGKLLFRPISLNYFRYEILSSSLILEGVLVGGAVFAYLLIRRNKWEALKVGDMIAPGLAIFQCIFFLGFWLWVRQLSHLLIFAGFALLYLIIRFLKYRKYMGNSAQFLILKRANRPIFTGGLLAVYLTGSSLIAILFLLVYVNLSSWFWYFQLVFYLSVLAGSFIFIKRHTGQKKSNMNFKASLDSNFVKRIKDKLIKSSKEVEKEAERLAEKDPFIQEYKDDGFRNVDSPEEEADDLLEHQNTSVILTELKKSRQEILGALSRIKNKKYGTCENCGNKISVPRLVAYPTARYCIKCKEIIEKRKR